MADNSNVVINVTIASIVGAFILIFFSYFCYNASSDSERARQLRTSIETYSSYVDKYRLEYDVLPVAKPEKLMNQELDVTKLEKVGFKPSDVTYEPVKFLFFFTLDVKKNDDLVYWLDEKGRVFVR